MEDFERNYGDIARFCARRAATAEDAEDAATEVFAIAWRRRSDLPPAPEDRLWLFGIARRVLANAARAERRRHRLSERLKQEPALELPGGGFEYRATATSGAGARARKSRST